MLSPRSETSIDELSHTEHQVRLVELHDGGGDGDREADDEDEEDEDEDVEETDDGFLGALINDVAERVAASSQAKQETSTVSRHSPTCTSPLLSRKSTSDETSDISHPSESTTSRTLNQDCTAPLLDGCPVGEL